MGRLVRNAVWLGASVVLLGIVAILLSAHFLTEYWWFVELGQVGVFWRLYAWPWGVRLAAMAIFAAFLYLNLRLTQPAIAKALLRFQDESPTVMNWRSVRRGLVAVSVVLGLLASEGVAQRWEAVARFVHRQPFGVVDPLLGKDVGFYMFELPVWRLFQSSAAAVVTLAFLLVVLIYFTARAVQWRTSGLLVEDGPRRHLLALAAAFVLLKALDYRLSLFELLYSRNSTTIFGATYTDWYARAVALRVLIVIALLTAVLLLLNIYRPRLRTVATATVVWLGASIVLGGIYPGLLQRFIVEPNELEREQPFIEHHLRFTRLAYGLEAIEEVDFDVTNDLTWEDLADNATVFENARLWDWRPLQRTYEQLQSIRFYYTFPDVDVDRYIVNGELRQVMLAARELDLQQIPNPTWVNQHLQYTHGYGVVMSPVRETTPQGLPRFYLADIPPRPRDVDVVVERPEIYYGELTNHYVIVGTRTPNFEFSYPSGDDNVRTTYAGKGGVPIGSLWRRAAFAVRTGTINLLLSDQIWEQTRILYYRNVMERVSRIAPFLRFDEDPYPVVADGRIYWIIDAYTTSDAFPYAMPHPRWRANYVRNSVKAIVDAYDGTVDLYIFDENDPIIKVYADIFPGLFRDASEMPEQIRAHVRYPEDMFRLQAEVYSMYHMRNPTIFYNREDVWRFAREVYSTGEFTRTREEVMDPYYVIVQLPDEPNPETVLMLPFTPSERNNMIAWLAARMDGDNYGRLLAYRFPKDELVYGPMQIEARIDQHPEIAQLLTLWAQRGSSVIRGNMLVLPIERSLLYLKPIYLQAETGELPELVRVIAAFGDDIAMHPTLEEALRAVIVGGAAVDATPPDAVDQLRPEPSQGDVGGTEQIGELPAVPLPPFAPTGEMAELAAEALSLYEQARQRLQDGDWAGFGAAIDQLEMVLRRLADEGDGPGE